MQKRKKKSSFEIKDTVTVEVNLAKDIKQESLIRMENSAADSQERDNLDQEKLPQVPSFSSNNIFAEKIATEPKDSGHTFGNLKNTKNKRNSQNLEEEKANIG